MAGSFPGEEEGSVSNGIFVMAFPAAWESFIGCRASRRKNNSIGSKIRRRRKYFHIYASWETFCLIARDNAADVS
jgi:hypothetical protein